ncbi:MAG TPA: ABC transporter permease [Actinomycetota bacterium]|jgi:ABC-type polysaccharide/polyol phosphate export permease|nr:ABC transporter permease [Actinomycetota bacterium]
MQAAKAEGFELRGTTTPLRTLIADLWEKRALIRLLARRDFHVRYRRATFGLVWVVAVPLIQATVLSIVFSRIVRVQVKTSYPVFMLSGLLPWLFFSMTITAAVTAITGASGLAAKVYFPRAILPLVVVRSNFYGFGLRLLVVIAAALLFGVGIGTSIVLLVPAVGLMIGLAAAFALVFAAMQVYFRDVNFIVTAVAQAWFWGSAVFYPISLVPEGPLRTLMRINPATGMVSLFRSAIIQTAPDWQLVGYSSAWIAGLLVASVFLYRRFDRVFTDLL